MTKGWSLALPIIVAVLLGAMTGWFPEWPVVSKAMAQTSGSASQPKAIAPEDLTLPMLQNAVDRTMAALYKLEPNYGIVPVEYFYSRFNHDQIHAMGNHALACWALLSCGESFQSPQLFRRINWVLSRDQSYTYDRGMRARMLYAMPARRWGPWINRDQIWLTSAITDQGNYGESWTGTPLTGFGDNANGQYGVLGLWATHAAGRPVSRDVWMKIDRYWRAAQDKTPGDQPAGWAVNSRSAPAAAGANKNNFYGRISGPMTAGAVASLFLTERILHGDKLDSTGKLNLSPELQKGLRWLDENFTPDDKDETADRYYYYWCMQQVGTTTGYRTFNNIDWFRNVTARILSEQQPNGTFTGRQGTLISTGFALLYMSKAFDPLAISKIRLRDTKNSSSDGQDLWNRRPHDIWNFVDFISEMYEVSTTWNVAELTQPVYQLRESPILYLSTAQPLALPEDQVQRLREYLTAGGMLLINLEANDARLMASATALTKQLVPDAAMQTIPASHPIYSINAKLNPNLAPMRMASNGIRPLVIVFNQDIGRGLQTNDPRSRDSFLTLSNLYLYAVGQNPRRARMVTSYLHPNPKAATTHTLSAARIKYEGIYDPEPLALRQLKTYLGNECKVDMRLEETTPQQLKSQKLAFLTTMGQGELTQEQADAIRRWLEDGGTLWLDAASGSMEAFQAAEKMVKQIAPQAPVLALPYDHPIITGQGMPNAHNNRRSFYRPYTLQRSQQLTHQPRLLSVFINQRPAIIFSTDDFTCGLAGLEHWGISGYQPTSARQLVANGCLYVIHEAALTAAANAIATQPSTAPAPATQPLGTAPASTKPATPAPPAAKPATTAPATP